MRATSGTRMVAGLVTILLALLSASLWSVAAAPTVSAATGGCGADMGTRQVVVLVHGFNSDMTTWTKAKPAMLAAVSGADPGNVYVRLFDYGAKSTQWVTDPAIGPALASFVRCLSKASNKARGPGKVIVVGHSMGGLAIRCALDAGCSANPVGKDQVGLVVTIGTPNAGSQLRASPAADSVARLAGQELLSLCDIAQIINGDQWLTTTCQYVRALGVSPAAQGFTIGSHEIDELAPYPLHIPVRAIAAAVTLQADIGLWSYPVPMGDLVVGVKSQLLLHTDDRLGGTRTVNCGAVNVLFDEPHCWHITETAFAGIQDEVRQAIKDYLTAHPSAPEPPVLTSQGVGPFHTGMTQSQANAAARNLGIPVVVPDGQFCSVIQPQDGSYIVFLTGDPNKTVAAVDVGDTHSSLRTDRGVGIGTTLAAVLAAYPEATVEPGFSGTRPTVIADYADGTSIRFDVDPATNRVTFMRGGAHDSAHAMEICG